MFFIANKKDYRTVYYNELKLYNILYKEQSGVINAGEEDQMMQTIDIESPIQAELMIHVVKDNVVNSKCTYVKVVEFTTTSLTFNSSLKFPVSEEVIYRMTLKIFGRAMEVYGMILTCVKSVQSEEYYYEMNFKVN
ncbi:MAG: hypothetical protein LPK26_12595 [Bacillaceae bacterium]|nr:hypothetical protein [Bacillaceae bacterium]